jgi:protein O-mannosyl-transferase
MTLDSRDVSAEQGPPAAVPAPAASGLSAEADGPAPRWMPWACAGAVALAVALVWCRTIWVPFHFDDRHTVREDADIRDLRNIPGFLAPGSFFNHGVLKVSYALNYTIAGRFGDGEPYPASYHAVNLANHALNAALVFALALLVLRRVRAGLSPRMENFAAALTALLFGVSTLNTTAVCLVSNRSELQMASFALVAIILGVLAMDGARRTAARWAMAAGAAACLVLSAGTKAPGIATVGLFIVVAWVVRRRRAGAAPAGRARWVWVASLAGAALTAAALFLVLFKQKQVWQDEYHGMWANFLTQSRVIFKYAGLLVVPAGLNIDRDEHIVRSLWSGWTPLAVGGLAAALAAALWLVWRGSLVGLGLAWFFTALAPSTSIIPRAEIMEEYRVYLASAGFYAAAVAVLFAVCQRWDRAARASPKKKAAEGRWLGLGLAAACLLAAATVLRIEVFIDPVALWADSAAKSPGKERPHYNLAISYERDGRKREAMDMYRRCLVLEPNQWEAPLNLGALLVERGEVQEAEALFRQAIARRQMLYDYQLPEFACTYFHLGRLLFDAGREEAISHFEETVALNPGYGDGPLQLARAYARFGKTAEAEAAYRDLIAKKPDNAEVWFDLGAFRNRTKDTEAAAACYRRAIELKPDYCRAWNNLGILLAKSGVFAEARFCFERALAVDPSNAEARKNLDNLKTEVDMINELEQ